MIRKVPSFPLLLFVLLLLAGSFLHAQQRFPKPEFESGYVQPNPTTPEPRAVQLEYVDVLILLAVLSLASWLAINCATMIGPSAAMVKSSGLCSRMRSSRRQLTTVSVATGGPQSRRLPRPAGSQLRLLWWRSRTRSPSSCRAGASHSVDSR